MNSEKETKREKFINNVLNLSVNAGNLNNNAKYILYSEETKENRKEKIKETKQQLIKIVDNIKNIAESLEIPLEDILK